jgi:hypothetical protein
MPTYEVGILISPFYRGDVWENQIRRNRNRQNLYVIWSLWPAENEVKRNSGRWKTTSKQLLALKLPDFPDFLRLCKTAQVLVPSSDVPSCNSEKMRTLLSA